MADKNKQTHVTREILDYVFDELSGGRSLADICSDESMPSERSIRRYMAKDPELKEQYFVAREMQADLYADRIVSLAEKFGECTFLDENGNERFDNAAINAIRAEIDTYKWIAGKLLKKVYGDSTNVNLSGNVDSRGGVVTDAMLEEIIKREMAETDLEEETVEPKALRGSRAAAKKAKSTH